MSISTTVINAQTGANAAWLRSRNWDLIWISLSVGLVTIPYLAYTGLLNLGAVMQPLAHWLGTDVDNLARNLINAFVALLVGGPHMYATFTRTALDRNFVHQHPRLLWSSLIIPVVVVTLALLNLSLLLTLFFFWASIHVLNQIIYILELYNQKQPTIGQKAEPGLERKPFVRIGSTFSRLADYGVVLTALYPLAAYRIVQGSFRIGLTDISAVVHKVLPVGPWMIWLAGGAFGLALAIWLAKTMVEIQQNSLHWPKTLFIALTVTASFFVPILGNLDTAFQGMNVWHSFQYLALTWMLNNLRQQRGELERSPLVERMSTDGSARRYYLFNIGLTVGDVLLAGVIFVALTFAAGLPFDYAFDRSYYIAVLSFLLIHYYHDHFLFSQPQVIKP